MFQFSTTEGTPIAVGKPIHKSKSKKDGLILYINQNESKDTKLNRELLKASDFNKFMKQEVFDEVLESLKSGIPPKDLKAREFYVEAKKIIATKMQNEFYRPDYSFYPIPRQDTRECTFIAGPSGSGKSTWVSHYAKNYNKIFPNNPIYLFSRLEEDEVLDQVPNLFRIHLTPEVIEEYEIKPNELQQSLVIFDDYDTIPNKKVKNFVEDLIDDLLQTGRHADTYVCITSHLMYNSAKTRIILNEIHSITLFPGRSTRHSLDYLLIKYFGMSKKQIGKIIDLGSRWVTIYKSPPIVIYDKGAVFLDSLK